ncbi:type II secretion system F family protein [Rhabdaerophilum sp. SD176]|uniref:type II secretion system F family protein n=1 Tax=Rhabdaerophilum sp. SD176 TaxID=2983548 RepID=UPI0022C421D8|nr:type II secretion system F family protein [Rhabdaerophilum sp. SD176]MCZ8375470.1 type II secretion system F family protein [Beijerinckiaceae bacterium]
MLDTLTNPSFIASVLTAIAVSATVITLGLPLLERNEMRDKMNAVALERDRIRARERERLNQQQKAGPKPTLRSSPGARAKQIVDKFNLQKWLSSETASEKLLRAGLRGPKAETTFLVARLFAPIGLILFAIFYLLINKGFGLPVGGQIGAVIAAAYLGIKAPEIYLSNLTSKRQASMRRAFPDALDLLLICVESGMSIEHAFRKVSTEIGTASVPMAEELALTTAELSYLPERRQAYENLAKRTGLDNVKSVTTVLIQAERYGTPLGQALRVLAQESRDQRMTAAEKKAAALPPKLTVPMIVFFMPALFIVILTPALIQIFKWK